jgi:hypothetical protein
MSYALKLATVGLEVRIPWKLIKQESCKGGENLSPYSPFSYLGKKCLFLKLPLYFP